MLRLNSGQDTRASTVCGTGSEEVVDENWAHRVNNFLGFGRREMVVERDIVIEVGDSLPEIDYDGTLNMFGLSFSEIDNGSIIEDGVFKGHKS